MDYQQPLCFHATVLTAPWRDTGCSAACRSRTRSGWSC
jgi:hypothetical protein